MLRQLFFFPAHRFSSAAIRRSAFSSALPDLSSVMLGSPLFSHLLKSYKSPTEPHEGQQDGLNSVQNVTLKPLHWPLILANFPRQIGPDFAILNRLYVRFRVRVP
jgi:hypothetical protein